MGLNLLKITITVLLLFSSVAVGEDDKRKTLVGSTAPSWALKTTDKKFEFLSNYVAPIGKQLRKTGDKDRTRKIVIQSFFATWCGPCMKEINALQEIQEAYSDEPVQFFLINLTDYFKYQAPNNKLYQEAKDAVEFLGSKGLGDITILEDNRGVTADQYGVSSILPRLFVIDQYQTVQMDERGMCDVCIKRDLPDMLDSLILVK